MASRCGVTSAARAGTARIAAASAPVAGARLFLQLLPDITAMLAPPDADGRRKLVWLYAGGLALADDIVELLVQKTQQGSAAFIKELMRRSAQASIEAGAGAKLTQAHVELALDEMLFSGGSLNRQLLGAAEVGAGGRKI